MNIRETLLNMKLTFLFATLYLYTAASSEHKELDPDSTPIYIIIAKEDGGIWRCLFKDLMPCELYYRGSSVVTSTVVHGEYMYASQDDGAIVKCEWYEKDSCKVIYVATSSVSSLTIAGGYLFASSERHLIRCPLSRELICEVVHSFDRRVMGVYNFDKYIYVGTDEYLSRCPKGSEVNCSHLAPAFGIVAGWKDDLITINSKCRINIMSSTSSRFTPSTSIPYFELSDPHCYHMTIFKGHMYVVINYNTTHTGRINMCEWEKNKCKAFLTHDKGTGNIMLVYSARHMRNEYLQRQNSCMLNPSPGDLYKYREEHRALMEAQVIDGKLCDARGEVVDTRTADEGYSGRAAVFAMGLDGQILLSTSHRSGLIHLASFFAGLPVAGAGEMSVQDGVITRIVACSQYYRADVDLNQQVVFALQAMGYSGDIALEPCKYTYPGYRD